VVSDVARTERSAPGHVGADAPARRQMAPRSPHSSSLPCVTPVRLSPEAGGQCVSSACWDLCWGLAGDRHSYRDPVSKGFTIG